MEFRAIVGGFRATWIVSISIFDELNRILKTEGQMISLYTRIVDVVCPQFIVASAAKDTYATKTVR
jgi:hypothetical protein